MASAWGMVGSRERGGDGQSESSAVNKPEEGSSIGSTTITLSGDTSHRSSILLSLKNSLPLQTVSLLFSEN
jgi:hypothetical protein